ncbi:MAG: CRTAC1 family protein [Balneolaceae bacterium]|nr:CRTAC1 family protein [Balneolaceae bacterium]MBO6547019.1 CRTAC1 family protein [Balneolaceae bacterium]MBO6648034.1 CRTAC1 family protein [Balneolaceae bacterium]
MKILFTTTFAIFVCIINVSGQNASISFIKSSNFIGNGGISGGVAWVDFEEDNYPELIFTNWGLQKNHFYSNEDGALVFGYLSPIEGNYSGIAIADLDADGIEDILTATQQNQSNYIFTLSKGEYVLSNKFSELDNSFGDSYSVSVFDAENDGDLEIFYANGLFQPDFFFRKTYNGFIKGNEGILNGTSASFGVSSADINSDGYQDIFVAKKGVAPNQILINKKNGDFELLTDRAFLKDIGNSNGGTWCDLDNDNDLDLFVANGGFQGGGEIDFLYVNEGNFNLKRLFVEGLTEQNYNSMSATCADFDNDGFMDLFVSRYKSTPILYRNIGGWNFKVVDINAFREDPTYATGNAVGDYDFDGDLDIAIANWENLNNEVFENTSAPNNWIRFRLEGTESNVNGIGTQLTLYTQKGHQFREIVSSHGFRSQSEYSAQGHFGLSDLNIIDSVKIKWPSGETTHLQNLSVNLVYTITEGRGIQKKTAPSTVEHFSTGLIIEKLSTDGIESLSAEISSKPESFELQALLDAGITIGGVGNVMEAKGIFNKASELYPKSSEAIFWIAFIDSLIGQNQQAKEGFKLSLKLVKKDPYPTKLKREEIINTSNYELSKIK